MPAKKKITKAMILTAAMELLREGGLGAVNVKALAVRLKCSTQPIYLSYSGMDELRLELIPAAISFFVGELERDGGPEAVCLYGMPYIRFASREPEIFKFLFMRQNAFEEMRQALSPITEHSISELMERYGLSHEEAHNFHDQLWMHTHGIASMTATAFCTWNMEKVERMLSECKKYLSMKYEVQNVQQ